MSEFFEYDPDYGIRTDLHWCEHEQTMSVVRTADVQPVLDFANWARNEAGLNKQGIDEGWWLYAKIPPIVQIQMHAKGIDIGNPDHQKRMFEEINRNYPHLKCTTGKEYGKGRDIYLG